MVVRFTKAFLRAALVALALAHGATGWAAAAQKIRVGVLSFGTVNWELDVVRQHRLAERQGVALEVVGLGGKIATAVALQGGAVDAIVTDWIWVSRQRHAGADFTFVPHSLAVGSLLVRPDAGIDSLADLDGRRLGIAGGPVDKSWLLLRGYAAKTLGTDLAAASEPVFAAPPLLNQFMLRGELPAVLNFWHYAARLEAAGMKQLISVADMLPALGVARRPPMIGWVFSEAWAARNPATIQGFLRSLRQAKRILADSDAEWERLRALTKAEDTATLRALRDAYRAGIPTSFGAADIAAAGKIFETLARYGGPALVGKAGTLAPGTFWAGYRY